MDSKSAYFYEQTCHQILQTRGIRFAGMINQRGRKIAGDYGDKITPLEKDEQKLEMLFMEIALDFSMRKEFNYSLGDIWAIVSYREKTNIITIPVGDNYLLLSSEPELDTQKVIQMAYRCLAPTEIKEVLVQ